MNNNNNPFDLSGKRILITGASSGIGKEVAIYCAKMNAKVIITGRNKERLEETRNLINSPIEDVIVADLSTQEGLNSLVTTLPKLDGAVLCAGFVKLYPIQFATTDKFENLFHTNLFSPIELLRNIVRKKLFNKGFSAVVIDSIEGNEEFTIANSIYGAGKAALRSFVKFFALEMAGKGIRINSISPGLILTPMQTQGAVSTEDLEKAVEKVPIKRWGKPEDIAPAAIYLLSNASSYVTGSYIKIDGGYTIR